VPFGAVSRFQASNPVGTFQTLIAGFPSFGDHPNSQIVFGDDGRAYINGAAPTNSSVVGPDNSWAPTTPTLHDFPGMDIELSGIGYQTLIPWPIPPATVGLDPAGGTSAAKITMPYMAFGGGTVPPRTVVKAPTPANPIQGIIAGGGTVYSFDPDDPNPTSTPGFSPTDLDEAASSDGQTRYKKTREGFHPLPNKDEHLAAWKWWESRTRDFGAWQKLSTKIAVLNIGAYHSTSFTDYQLLAALPSCRVSLDWAQNCLFPEAVAGKRAVICLRSSRFWGLQQGQSEGSLYAPTFHRGGFIQKNDPLRPAIIKDVQQRLGTA
jgi:hypothetical protein